MKKKKLRKKLIKSYQKNYELTNALVSVYDSLKLHDLNQLEPNIETLSECFFRKLKAWNVDLNKEMGWTHLKPVTLKEAKISFSSKPSDKASKK